MQMKTVVIIDDEPLLLKTIVSLLNEKDVVGHPFTNGHKALDYIKNNQINAILVDLAMPEISGIEIISKVREFSKDLPIIAMSGMDWKDTLLKGALIAGANKILVKPFEPSNLYSAIAEVTNPK